MDKYIKYLLLFFLILAPFFDGGRNAYFSIIFQLVVTAAILGWLTFSRRAESIKLFQFIKAKRWLWAVSLLGFLFLLFSIILSASPLLGIRIFLQNYFVMFLVFLFVSETEIAKDDLTKFFQIIFYTAAIVSLAGYYFYLEGNYFRMTSTFFWPNPLAGYLLFSIPIGIYFVSTRKRLVDIFLLAIIFSAFVLTGSRGAYLALVSGISILFIYKIKTIRTLWKKVLPPCILAVIIAILLIGAVQFLKNPAFNFLQRSSYSGEVLETSMSTRLDYWRGAWQIFLHNPLFGTGPDSFATIYPRYQTDVLSSSKYPHNWLLESLAEEGIIVTVVLSTILIFLISQVIKRCSVDSRVCTVVIAIFASVSHNLIDVDWHFLANQFLFTVCLGLLLNNFLKSGISVSGFRKKANHKSYSSIAFNSIVVILFFPLLACLASDLYFYIGESRFKDGKLGVSLPNYFKSARMIPDPDYSRKYAYALYVSALETKDRNILALAQNEIDGLIRIDQQNSQNYYIKGRIIYAAGDPEEALQDFSKAIQIDPHNYPSYYNDLALDLISLNRNNEAIVLLKEAIAFYPKEIVQAKMLHLYSGQVESSGFEKEVSSIQKLYQSLTAGHVNQ